MLSDQIVKPRKTMPFLLSVLLKYSWNNDSDVGCVTMSDAQLKNMS